VIEGDERIVPNLNASIFAPAADEHLSRQFDESDRFVSNRRDGGNSQFAPGGDRATSSHTVESRDNLLALQAYGDNLLEICSARQQASLVQVPWVSKEFLPGDAIRTIVGTGFDFVAHARTGQLRYPNVVGVMTDGRTTTLLLDDFRLIDEASRLTATRPPPADFIEL